MARRRSSSPVHVADALDFGGDLRQLSDFTSVMQNRLRIQLAVSALEDRRRWYPEVLQPAVSVTRAARRIIQSPRRAIDNRKVAFMNSRLAFAQPFRVAVCAKRKIRKEVMFALGRGGKGGPKKDYRRNQFSGVKC